MDTHYDIEKLATELILYVFREFNVVKRLEVEFRHDFIGKALQSTGEAFSQSFRMLHVRYAMEDLDPEQFGLKCILVCLKMSREPHILHTMLACAFITESVAMLAMNKKCFKFVLMARKCLIVLLKKKLGNEPDDVMVSWRAFKEYILYINAGVSRRREHRSILDVITEDFEVRQSTLKIVQDCFPALPEEIEDLTLEDTQFLDADDIPKDLRANFASLPACGFCQQECVLSVHFCLREFLNRYSKEYEIMR